MKWGLVCKPSSDSFAVGEAIYKMLNGKGVFLEKKIAEHMGKRGYSIEELDSKADAMIVVGGDGTILTTLQQTSKPIFSINTGRIGFLTEVEKKDAGKAIQKLLKGEYRVEERLKLKGKLRKKRLPDAANEITIHSASIGKILPIKLYVDGILTQSFLGDGLILATPMGSTSYALSVGGPVVDPVLEVFILAPIAPFRHIASALVIPADKTLKIKVEKPAIISIDGIHTCDFKPSSTLSISTSEKKARFIKLEDNFYRKIYRKLSFRYPRSL
ncbi:MAG: NAD(+)/NADH kinase [Thermoplasmata archaeon]|jgi:NAD+ kinase|nr:NAD(+)/NADH kinase [Thermoplasmata archaeon]